ncbi:hypothetical protein [Rhodococcus sp. WB9]|uniref:hypothetical protein n=1 Tax=Rhodococcus sp. WB9 TaxID=2594007 RepID=UPI0021B49E62|nr:hypothetical protein [Rhodococcus sp. WB9]
MSEDVANQILAGVGLGDRVLDGDLVVADGGEDAFGDRRVVSSPAVDREVLEFVVRVLFVRDLGVEVLATDFQEVLIEAAAVLVLRIACLDDVGDGLVVGDSVQFDAGCTGGSDHLEISGSTRSGASSPGHAQSPGAACP